MHTTIRLAPPERRELQTRARSRTLRAEDVRRARLILALARGESFTAICQTLGCNRSYISRWKARFLAERIAGLYARHLGRAVAKRTPRLEAKILEWTRRTPTDGSTHWSTRRLAKALGINHMMVARVWARAGLQPHRVERYLSSDDPDFEAKAADIIGLYINPPRHAAVFCVDEKTAIQALDRRDPVLPLSPGRAERHGFEYVRHGTLSLYAALNTKTGEVLGKTARRHTSAEFVAFLADIVANQPRTRPIHVITDNLSAHKTKLVTAFLDAHPRVSLHYTPTSSSWLNQVELWFGKIDREVIARGIFTSVADLRRKLMRYIRHYNKAPKPIKWVYRDPTHRIKTGTNVAVTTH
jgi:transposase